MFFLKPDSADGYSNEHVFRAVMLLRICLIIVIYFTVNVRVNIPSWMHHAFRNATYPLFAYSCLLFIFSKKVSKLLRRHSFLLIADLAISVGLVLIGAGWRSSYFAYTFTTIIIFTLFVEAKGTWISTLILLLTSLIKNPVPAGEDVVAFSATNMDMRLGAVLAYIVAGIIIGYFRHLLDRIRSLSEERIVAIQREAVMEQKVKLALDLHDNIKSKINAIVLLYNPLLKRLFKEKSEDREELLRLWKWHHYLQNETMRFFISLKSTQNTKEDTSFDLVSFVKEEISLFKEMTQFSWYLVGTEKEVLLPWTYKQSVIQFLGEGMLNAWKHSGVSDGEIKIYRNDSAHVELEVSEQGKGFRFREGMLARCSGIRSLHLRAEELKGSLEIKTAPGSGSTLILRIPLPGEAE